MNAADSQLTLPTGQPAMLQATGVRRCDGERVLLDDVSVSIQGGDRIAVVGPTGSGKTLLLRSLAKLDRLDAGDVLWHGTPVRGHDVPRFRSQVIYLHQRPTLIEGTVEDNLRHPFSLRVHQDKPFHRERVVDLLLSLGRDDSFLLKQQRDLSGGESQLTSLLRAIQLNPSILLLDESTAALDPTAASIVETLVTNWLNKMPAGRATVWVTHDQQQAERIADRILELDVGCLRPRSPT